MFKILTFVALAFAAAMGVAGLCLDRVAATPLTAGGFRVNKSNDAGFTRLPKKLQEAAARGWPVRVWINGRLAEEAGSVEALAASKTPTYRVKSGIMLYVNDALKGKMATDSVVVAADLPGKVLDWSKMAFAAASLCSIFWLLRPFHPPAPTVTSSSKGRLVTLDSLRGVAATIVMLVHAAGMFMPASWLFDVTPSPGWEQAPAIASWIKHTPLAIFLNGSLMVHLFWVMSGLVLSAPLLRTGSSQHIAKSTAKRYFRLAPLAIVTTLASYFMHVGSWYSVAEYNAGTRFGVAMLAFSGGTELALSSALRDALLFGSGYNMPLWTIKYEFLGSLFLFGLLACTLPLKRRRLIWGACLLFLALALPSNHFYLADFVAGLFLADLLVNNNKIPPLGKAASILLAAIALALGSATPGWLTALVGPVSTGRLVLFHLVPAGILVLLALRSGVVGSLLRLRPLVWLGERSFAIYVVHALTIHLVGHGVAAFCLNHGLPPFASSAIGFVVFLAFTLWISDWLTKWVDIPSTHFASFIGHWLSGEPGKPAPSPLPTEGHGSHARTGHREARESLPGPSAATHASRQN